MEKISVLFNDAWKVTMKGGLILKTKNAKENELRLKNKRENA